MSSLNISDFTWIQSIFLNGLNYGFFYCFCCFQFRFGLFKHLEMSGNSKSANTLMYRVFLFLRTFCKRTFFLSSYESCSWWSQFLQRCPIYLLLKVRQSRNDFFKPTLPPKNERRNSTLLLWKLRLTCFRSFFGGNWRHQKDISKLTDL